MIRKVKFPLRYKFVTAISLLLLLTMTFYLSYALNIFKEDKAADIYSITLSNSISLAERVKLLVNQDISLINNLSSAPDKMSALITSEPHVLGAECFLSDEQHVFAGNSNSESKQSFQGNSNARSYFRSLPAGTIRIETALIPGFPPHYSVLKAFDDKMKCALHISFEKMMPLMNETLNYGTYIISDGAKLFLRLNAVNLREENLKNIVSDPTLLNVQQGVKRFEEKEGTIIRAFSKIAPLGLIAITEIEEEKAFLASTLLIQKSLYFGLLILSIAVITGILFTKRMTKNVQTLFEATTRISEGDFNVSPQAPGHDEIGALTDSFVYMKDKIIAFMAEMKEKARIEGELKVAQLVQNSFFPRHGIIKKDFSVEGMYSPASECSGDWWGYFEQESKVTIIACDATGHGVPAALITAAAHSCVSTLKLDAEKTVITPKDVLDKLNKVICSMNSEILMTAFVLEIDEKDHRVTYSNASHMTPIHIGKIEGTYSKEGVSPLNGNNGPRMGEKIDSIYQETSFEYHPGDRIFLYSDGLTEMEVENKAWGQRNFLKSLYKNSAKSSNGIIEGVMQDFRDFAQGVPLQDDITLIAVAIREDAQIINDVSEASALLESSPDFVVSKLSNEENIHNILSVSSINHLIGYNTIDFNSEIKLLEILESRDVFKLDDYLNGKFKKKIWKLNSNNAISEVIGEMITLFAEDYTPAINSDILHLVSEELLSNSFYHAVMETESKRGEEIILPYKKEVEYLFAANQEYVVLSVKGPSSFSSREKIISSIHRGYTDKSPLEASTAGAGLGLYLIYENCQQFWVINSPPTEGQIICVFEKFNRYKKAKERVTSFHYLSKEIR